MKAHLISIYTMILYACTISNTPDSSKPNHIVIILDSTRHETDTIRFQTGAEMIVSSPIFRFLPDNATEKIPPIYKTTDTLLIPLNCKHVLVQYRFSPMSTSDFLVDRGDTLIIKHINGNPFITISNRKILPLETNYDFYKRSRYAQINQSSLTEHLLDHPGYLRMKTIIDNISYDKLIANLYQTSLSELTDEHSWIDSLKNAHLISISQSKYLMKRNQYIHSMLDLTYSNQQTKEDLRKILTEYNDSTYQHDYYRLYRPYYLEVTERYYLSSPKTKLLPAYKQLNDDNIINGKLKEDVLSGWLFAILEECTNNERDRYFHEIVQQLTDTVLVGTLHDHYRNVFNKDLINSAKLELMDSSQKRLTFEDVLLQNKGKVVYVDFWASWCSPCMKEMNASKKLREIFQDKDVAFIYLSLDDNMENWQQAIPKATLENTKYNYRILNTNYSRIMRALQITSIPRYILYDRNGNIASRNAPRASSEEIKDIFKELLSH